MMYTFWAYIKKSYYQEPHEDIWWCDALMILTMIPLLVCVGAAGVRKMLGK